MTHRAQAAGLEFVRAEGFVFAHMAAKGATRLPVLLGSGITPDNLARYWEAADGFIIGSYFKEGG